MTFCRRHKKISFFQSYNLACEPQREERGKWERGGGIISVKIAKSPRHGEVIAQSELSRRFLTFTTAGDLRFIYASRTPLCNNNTRERRGRGGRRRSHGGKEVAAPLTRINDTTILRDT